MCNGEFYQFVIWIDGVRLNALEPAETLLLQNCVVELSKRVDNNGYLCLHSILVLSNRLLSCSQTLRKSERTLWLLR